MASPISWCTRYHRNQLDGGVLQRSLEIDAETWDKVTLSHTDEPSIMKTLNALPESTFFIVPGSSSGNVNFLHHGFSHTTQIGGASIGVFVHGNLNGSPFKVIPTEQVVKLVSGAGGGARTRGGIALHCPSLSDMCDVRSADEFSSLPQGENSILENRPNHFVISGAHFIDMNGPKSESAAQAAFRIIETHLRLPEKVQIDNEDEEAKEGEGKEAESEDEVRLTDEDDQETESIKESRKEYEALIAYLWVIANDGAPAVQLIDPPEDQVLFGRMGKIRAKLVVTEGPVERLYPESPPATPTRRGRASADEGSGFMDPNVLAIATQGLITTLSRIDKDRQADRREDRAEKSLFRGLGPNQRSLLERLSTRRFDVAPAFSTFMTAFMKEKHAIKAVGQMKYETRSWPGTFSDSAFQRFLTSGFVSQETSASHLGGFTVFMCYPKAIDVGTVPINKDKAKIRDMLGISQSDDVVEYFSKKSFFVSTNTNDLKIQLQTCLNLLEKLSCLHTIAGSGLRYILRKYDGLTTMFAEMFDAVPNFGAQFLYSVDRALQFFFTKVQEAEDVLDLSDWEVDYPETKAIELMDGIRESRAPSTVILPACLRDSRADSPTPSLVQEGFGKRSEGTDSNPSKKKRKAGPNKNVEPTWKLPPGKKYGDYFLPKSENLRGWPTFANADGVKKHLCIKFQTEGRCRDGCTLAHPDPKSMSKEVHSQVSARFTKVYET